MMEREEFIVLMKNKEKIIIPKDDISLDSFNVGDSLVLIKEPLIYQRIKDLAPEVSRMYMRKKLKKVTFEDSPRRHGFFVIFDVKEISIMKDPPIATTNMFIPHSFEELHKLRDYLITIFKDDSA